MSKFNFTADDARKIAGPSMEDYIQGALDAIKASAQEKNHEISLRNSFWVNGGYSKTEAYKAATKVLEDLGFGVEFIYEERQFVDMYTKVTW